MDLYLSHQVTGCCCFCFRVVILRERDAADFLRCRCGFVFACVTIRQLENVTQDDRSALVVCMHLMLVEC